MSNLTLLMENFTNGYKSGFLDILSFSAVFFGISVIVSKNPIVSVLFLITLFCIVASYLITLGMHFIGLSYLLVYVGAISILFLFILMLINIRISELVTDTKNSIPLAVIAGSVFIISVYAILPFDLYKFDIIDVEILNRFMSLDLYSTVSNTNFALNIDIDKTVSVTSKGWDNNLYQTSHITSIGNVMYSEVFIWLIVTSIILLLAMVGAIVITIKTTSRTRS